MQFSIYKDYRRFMVMEFSTIQIDLSLFPSSVSASAVVGDGHLDGIVFHLSRCICEDLHLGFWRSLACAIFPSGVCYWSLWFLFVCYCMHGFSWRQAPCSAFYWAIALLDDSHLLYLSYRR